MNQFRRLFESRTALLFALLPVLLAGCSGSSLDPILGTPSISVAPLVTATSPIAGTTGVAANSTVTATFSKSMAPATLTATSFTLECPAGTPIAAAVAYVDATKTATLTPSIPLPPNTLCVATVTTAAQDSTGLALTGNFVWSFMTAPLGSTTRPTVILTAPAAGAIAVANNTAVAATFSKDMNPTTISATSFTLVNTTLGTAVAGSVSYSAGARTAVFAPTGGVLANNSVFTATITTTAADVGGNTLAANFVWTFTTGVTADATAPTVTGVSPADASTGVCLTAAVTATFSKPMDPGTIGATTFVVTAAGVAVAGAVSYDAVSQTARFVPSGAAGFAASTAFVATVKSGAAGVKDLAGNALVADRTWSFTTGTQPCLGGANLGSASTFGAFGGTAGVTNQGINTTVGGNLGSTAACTLITGFHDAANVYTETPLNVGGVNGSIYCGPPAPGNSTTLAVATQERADATIAYNDLAGRPAGGDPGAGELGGLTLAPAVYTAAGGTFKVTNGDLVLDAGGNSNAVWVFQMAAGLTVGQPALPRQVKLINGAQAANVYWQVGSAARIEDQCVMVGTIIAQSGVTISTAGQLAQTTLIGRALSITASVTMVNTTIVAP